MINQTIHPTKWIIVDDGSNDSTTDIVKKYLEDYRFIELLQTNRRVAIGFSSKVAAFNRAYERLRDTDYSFIGNIDADVSFEPEYFEKIIAHFDKNPKLGVSGGVICELQGRDFKKLNYYTNSVAGAVQLFRKQCFEDIGGYIPIEKGGIDAVAEAMARMNNWQVRTYTDIEVFHHRRIGTVNENILSAKFRYGVKENLIGTHPIFLLTKCIKRYHEKPFMIGAMTMICGYVYSLIRGDDKAVSSSFVKYIRNEQLNRLKSIMKR